MKIQQLLTNHLSFVIYLAWGLLYSAFVGVGFLLHAHILESGAAEICGWDYQTFVGQIQDWRWIGYSGFRHPGLGLVFSPLVALEHVWSEAYLYVMPLVATATAWLIWKLSNWLGLLVWLSFPTTWLMAGIPESFPLAQLVLVASVWLELSRGEREERGETGRWLIVGGLACLNGLITLTNGVKPLLGYLVVHWRTMDRKVRMRGGLAVVGLMVVGVVFFYVRTLMTGRGMGPGLAATLRWIPAERNLPRELYGFFIRPVGFYQSFVVYPLAIFGVYQLIRARNTSYFLLLTSYFAVDVVIHLVVGWGMSEPWVFASHWVWILPVLVASCCDISGKVPHGATYEKNRFVIPNGRSAEMHGWFTGNVVLVPRQVCEQAGLPFFVASKFVGVCTNNWKDKMRDKFFGARLAFLWRPGYSNLHDFWLIRSRYHGTLRALVSCLHMIALVFRRVK